MMLITTAAILIGLGWVGFIVGFVFNIMELGVLGGVIVLSVGAVAVGPGISEVTGKIEHANNDGSTEIEKQTEKIPTPQQMSLGTILMIIGGVQVLRSFEKFSRL